VAHESEEARYHVRLVAIAHELEVDGSLIEKEAEEGDDGVDGYHCEDSDDAIWLVCEWQVGRSAITASARRASGSGVHDRESASQRWRLKDT
jgi:hypothetical protein